LLCYDESGTCCLIRNIDPTQETGYGLDFAARDAAVAHRAAASLDGADAREIFYL
jgi:hypothetical protein